MMMFSSRYDALGPVTEPDHHKEDSLCLFSKGPKSIIGVNGKDDCKICFV